MNRLLSPADISLLAAYLLFILFVGFTLIRRSSSSAEEFLLAGRKLTLPSFVATLVSTWYGGILGVGEYSYRYGISNWLVFGVPYYLAAIIFALLLAKKARRMQLYTIPHQLEKAYGKPASILGAFMVFIMTAPAAYVLMLAILIQFILGWPLWLGLIAGTLFSLCYVWVGGFRSVVRTDIVQFILMFGGFALILPFAFIKYGGLAFLQQNLPASHFLWHGGQGAQFIWVWYFIALSTLVEPGFYQRCFAAKNASVAKNGILISVLFWLIFDFMTTFTGLYARAVLPDLPNPVTSYLDFSAIVLPAGIHGLFLVGLLATIMSTIDSYSFLAAMTAGRDILWRLLDGKNEGSIQRYTRIGLLLTAVLSIAIALWAKSVIAIWKQLGSIGTPTLLVPLVASFFPKWRFRKGLAVVAMVSGFTVSAIWALSNNWLALGETRDYWLGFEPIFPGLFVTVVLLFLNRFLLKSKDAAQ